MPTRATLVRRYSKMERGGMSGLLNHSVFSGVSLRDARVLCACTKKTLATIAVNFETLGGTRKEE